LPAHSGPATAAALLFAGRERRARAGRRAPADRFRNAHEHRPACRGGVASLDSHASTDAPVATGDDDLDDLAGSGERVADDERVSDAHERARVNIVYIWNAMAVFAGAE
jgi:hypothetical protein